jgi:hypothetical protein
MKGRRKSACLEVYVRFVFLGIILLASDLWAAQSPGGAGTIDGAVTDPSGAAVPGATVQIGNPITRYRREAKTDATGGFRFTNVPPQTYHISITAAGFTPYSQDVTVRTAVPITIKPQLALAGGESSVTVEGAGEHLVENVPYAHNDVERSSLAKLPALSPGSSLSDAIIFSTPGVAADSNGFFHPLGDHAQTTFSIDGQPISDQQSKQFSTQLPLNAIQSMELITGAPNAEFGDKTSLVVNAQTRSGLGQKPFGSLVAQYGSFGTAGEEGSLGFGGQRAGNFLVFNVTRSGRFLDTPEFWPAHAAGNNGTMFDRIDFQPTARDSFHLNLFAARNWFQVPNTYDQPGQDQRQRVLSFNVAPGYQHTFNAKTLLSLNPFFRRDQVNYYPSRDPFSDSPATLSQRRFLSNYGVRADLAYASGIHNVRAGTQIMRTSLSEQFSMGLTDPVFNSVCVDAAGSAQLLPAVTNPESCRSAGFRPNPDLQPGLIPFDLTRGGRMFQFNGKANINQYALYAQDAITLGALTVNAGLRLDRYDGLSQATALQPRLGVSYRLPQIGTVLRASYSRTLETPYNENLVLSGATGQGGLATNVFGAFDSVPIQPGRRNQYNAGIEQGFGKYLVAAADYFWKSTSNAFDFGTLLNTPVQFPISWRRSKIDGVSLRLGTPNLRGMQASVTMGHTRSRYFGPSNGGLIFNSPLDTGVFRIDHDQAFQQTTNIRYELPNHGPWAAFTWRYDSGLVAGAVPDLEAALELTAAQQAAIGFYCGGTGATVTNRITECTGAYGASRLRIPAAGTADADHNPPRIAPRNVFDIAIGADNLFRRDRIRTTARFTVLNVTNNVALYNFLSTFSGTHFVTPRSYQAEIGVNF